MPARPGLSLEKVVDGALSLIERNGPAALSLTRLAKELEVKPPSLYNHIGGIDDLQRALRLRGLHELGNDLQRAAVGRSGETALRAIARTYREFALRSPALYQLTLRSPEREDEELVEAGRVVVDVARAVLEGYGLEGDAIVHATRILRSTLHGFVSLELSGGYAMPQDSEETFEVLLGYLDAGIRSSLETEFELPAGGESAARSDR